MLLKSQDVLRPTFRPAWVTALTLLAGTVGCGSEDGGPGPNGEPPNVPGTELWINPGDGVDHGLLTSISAESDGSIERSFTNTVQVEGAFADGYVGTISAYGTWKSPDTVEVVGATVDGVEIKGLEIGTWKLTVELGTLDAEVEVEVVRASIASVAIEVPETVERNNPAALKAIATLRDDSEIDMTEDATWALANPSLGLIYDDAGRKGVVVPYVLDTPISVSAVVEGTTAQTDIVASCSHDVGGSIRLGQTLPSMSWPSAIRYDEAGNRQAESVSAEDLKCDARFDDFNTFAFSMNAGWCVPCHGWIRRMTGDEQAARAAGMYPVFVVGDDEFVDGRYDAATTEYAERLVDTHDLSSFGLRVGDADTQGLESTSGVRQVLAGGWPTIFMVRKRDMKVIRIGTNLSVPAALDFADSAQLTSCAGEEALEPNDHPLTAGVIGLGTTQGSLCNGSSEDFFHVKAEGSWELVLSFDPRRADLDLAAWDISRGNVLIKNGRAVRSDRTTDPDESTASVTTERILGEGNTIVRIYSKLAGTDYTITVEEI